LSVSFASNVYGLSYIGPHTHTHAHAHTHTHTHTHRYKDLASDVYDLSLQTGMVNATSKSSATLIVQAHILEKEKESVDSDFAQ